MLNILFIKDDNSAVVGLFLKLISFHIKCIFWHSIWEVCSQVKIWKLYEYSILLNIIEFTAYLTRNPLEFDDGKSQHIPTIKSLECTKPSIFPRRHNDEHMYFHLLFDSCNFMCSLSWRRTTVSQTVNTLILRLAPSRRSVFLLYCIYDLT